MQALTVALFPAMAMCAFHATPLHAPVVARRSSLPAMGGTSGLPRMPIRAWPLTKKFNPSGEYKLEITTLWRDLEITMGSEELAFRAAKRCPALLNPQYSNRWVFFRSKDLVTRTLGSERKAIDLFLSDPSLLQAAQYDGLNPKLEKMLSTVDPGSTSPNAPTPIMNTAALLGSVTFVVLVALVTSEKFLPS